MGLPYTFGEVNLDFAFHAGGVNSLFSNVFHISSPRGLLYKFSKTELPLAMYLELLKI